MNPTELALTEIIVDATWSVRERLDEATVRAYMDSWAALPPVEVWELVDQEGRKVLVDGFHRYEAHRRLEHPVVPVRLGRGTAAQARERAIVANTRHGRPYTPAERRRATAALLRLHPEWADNYVAQVLGQIISAPTVRAVREELEAAGEITRQERLLGADGKRRPRDYGENVADTLVITPALPPLPSAPPADRVGSGRRAGGGDDHVGAKAWLPVQAAIAPPLAAPEPPAAARVELPPGWLLQAHALHLPLATASVDLIVTSPPFYQKRDYDGGEMVFGGRSDCTHEWGAQWRGSSRAGSGTPTNKNNRGEQYGRGAPAGAFCGKCGAWRGQLGLEPSLDLYVEHLATILNTEAWRVLRPTGTLWVNLADSFANDGKWGGATGGKHVRALHGATKVGRERRYTNLAAGNLMGVPWRVTLAMQGFAVLPATTLLQWAEWLREAHAQGDWDLVAVVEQRLRLAALIEALQAGQRWRLRQEVLWIKGTSGQKELTQQVYAAAVAQGIDPGQAQALSAALDPHVGSCMPNNVTGTRWVRHELPCPERQRRDHSECPVCGGRGKIPCLGCRRCLPHGGYVLEQGQWRPTDSYEVVLLFAKEGASSYYCDDVAGREEYASNPPGGNGAGFRRPTSAKFRGQPTSVGQGSDSHRATGTANAYTQGGRNLRAAWTLAQEKCALDHYAVFPAALPEIIIRVATSAAGVCPQCGAPWARVVEQADPYSRPDNPNPVLPYAAASGHTNGCGKTTLHKVVESATQGWRPTCACAAGAPVPAKVLDLFCGTATTVLAARRLGRIGLGVDVSWYYLHELARARVLGANMLEDAASGAEELAGELGVEVVK